MNVLSFPLARWLGLALLVFLGVSLNLSCHQQPDQNSTADEIEEPDELQEPDRAPQVVYVNREAMRVLGQKCLAKQDWQQAGEVFATLWDELPRATDWAWEKNDGRNDQEQARYQYRLIHFLVWHLELDSLNPPDTHILRYAAEYDKLLPRLPKLEQKDALDFSHLDLFREVVDAYFHQGQKVTREHRAKVFAALQRNPDSVPALAAFNLLAKVPENNRNPEFWKTAEAVHTERLSKLYLARVVADRSQSEQYFDLELAERVLSAGWQLAPSNEHKARLLYSLAAVCVRLQAMAFVRQLQARGPDDQGGLDQAPVAPASNQQVKKHLDQARELLHELVEKYPESRPAPQAMLRLAEVYAHQGDPVKQRDWLLRCAAAKQYSILPNTRADAHRSLAVLAEERRDWKEAVQYWRAYRPVSFCGTCLAGMHENRTWRLACCYAQMNRHASAARVLADQLTRDGMGWSGHLAVGLFELYRQAGQLNDLAASLSEFDDHYVAVNRMKSGLPGRSREELLRYTPTASLHELLRIHQLERKRDVQALLAICKTSERSSKVTYGPEARGDGKCRAAAEALARCGKPALQAICDEVYQPDGLRHIWLIYALGHHPSPEALPILRDLGLTPHDSGSSDVYYALLLKGKPGLQVLKDMRVADAHLDPLRKTLDTEGPWPPARRGSLPRQLPQPPKPKEQ